MQTECHCPTCGAPYTAERPRVDLDRNIFICAAGTAKLHPQQAEIASVIAAKHPHCASTDTIITRVYGGSDIPLTADNLVRVQMHALRRAIRPLGWRIISTYGRGYMLLPATRRSA